MVDPQSVINILLGLCGGVFGWILKSIWEAVRDLQKADDEIADKVNELEVMMAGAYATREELRQEFTRIFQKLDSIDHKLDRKADK